MERLCITRGLTRDKGSRGQLLFRIVVKNCSGDSEYYNKSIECIEENKKLFKKLWKVVKEWKRVAELYPDTKRLCISCDTRVYDGEVFCCEYKRCSRYRIMTSNDEPINKNSLGDKIRSD